MTIRKTVTLIEEINNEYGARASPPLRRVAIGAVFVNPLAGKAAGADLKPLIDYSLGVGASLTKAALAMLGASPAHLRAYTKAALVGISGDLEHGVCKVKEVRPLFQPAEAALKQRLAVLQYVCGLLTRQRSDGCRISADRKRSLDWFAEQACMAKWRPCVCSHPRRTHRGVWKEFWLS
jgi:hypothetical protein